MGLAIALAITGLGAVAADKDEFVLTPITKGSAEWGAVHYEDVEQVDRCAADEPFTDIVEA